MNSIELIKQLLARLKKFSWVIAIIAAAFGGLFYYVAKQSVLLYTSKSTVFPLNGNTENSPGATISSLLGLGESTKSFTGDASINIVELAGSRRTREAVAMVRIKLFRN